MLVLLVKKKGIKGGGLEVVVKCRYVTYVFHKNDLVRNGDCVVEGEVMSPN